jgi:magnesium-transporting ATPase (P-type)
MSKDKQDLQNIKYKSMILSNNNYNNLSPREINDVNNINDFLEKEKQQHTGDHWSKLDKTNKMQKIRIFVEQYSIDNSLTEKDTKTLILFLTASLDQKKLSKTKDVVYDKYAGVIKSIPCLIFNTIQRKFTLKRSEKRPSTMKSLAPKRANKTRDHKIKTSSRPSSALNSKNNSNHNSEDESAI